MSWTAAWTAEEKAAAVRAVNHALRKLRGSLNHMERIAGERPLICLFCGRLAILEFGQNGPMARSTMEAHHPDYSRPLEVEWRCGPCHAEAHR